MSILGRLRSLYLAAGLAVLTLTSFGCCAVVRVLLGHRHAKRLHELILGQGIYYWMAALGIWRLHVRGTPPPANEVYVVVANHASFADHAVVSFLPVWKKYLTKSRYFTLPFFGWTQWIVSDIGVDVTSKESRARSVAYCEDMVKKGNSVVIYPEGTRVSPGTLGEFKEGAFRIAKDCKVKMLPVCLHNTQLALQKGFVVGSAKMVLSIGEPFEVDDIPAAIARVREWMEKDLAQGDQAHHRNGESKKTK